MTCALVQARCPRRRLRAGASIEVPAGKRFRLEISNEGKTAMEFESRDLKQEKVIPPAARRR